MFERSTLYLFIELIRYLLKLWKTFYLCFNLLLSTRQIHFIKTHVYIHVYGNMGVWELIVYLRSDVASLKGDNN